MSDTKEGTRVERFQPGQVFTMPIQVWHDAWRSADRVLRFVGLCVVCGMPTWGADDGENDPRGVLGDHATHALVASDHEHSGPDVPLCAMCGNDEWSYERALGLAVWNHWKTPGEADETDE